MHIQQEKGTHISRTLRMIMIGGIVCGTLLTGTITARAEDKTAAFASSDRDVLAFKKQLDIEVPKLQDTYGVPGVAVGLVHDGQVAFTLNYGYADVKNKKPLNNDTRFQAGSMSKSLTAWGIMHLVSKGLVSLDAPVQQYIKRWKLPDSKFNNEVTLRRLLNHTAGLGAHKGYLGVAPGEELSSIEESLSGVGWTNEPLQITTQPGREAAYSGAGYTLLQLVIEEVSGMPFDSYMDTQVLAPLGMQSSSFRQDVSADEMSKAYGYFGQELPNFRFTEQAAAGLATTAGDMMKFMLASMGGASGEHKGSGVVSSSLVDEMQQPVLAENGLGIFSRPLDNSSTLLYHSGDNRGWHSLYGFFPENGDGLVILTNSENGIDLRQDIYYSWLKYQTGTIPEGSAALAAMRQTNSRISWALGAALGAYVLVFALRLYSGRRAFITKHARQRFFRLGIRMILLTVTGTALFFAAYVWSIMGLSSGNTTNIILISAWIVIFLITGFFPKTRKTYS